MSLQTHGLKPLERSDGRRTAIEVYDALQSSILSGRFPPGTILSQVEMARLLKVSRTPVREAMRMLQKAGLLVGEPNFRSRVVGVDPNDIEALYMKRIVLESMAVSITTSQMSAALGEEIAAVIDLLESKEAHQDFDLWLKHHRRLHYLLVSGAGDALVNELEELQLRSERYQYAHMGENLAGWQRCDAEHNLLFKAAVNGDSRRAAELTARHLARTGLELMAALAPEHHATKLRASWRFALYGATDSGKGTEATPAAAHAPVEPSRYRREPAVSNLRRVHSRG